MSYFDKKASSTSLTFKVIFLDLIYCYIGLNKMSPYFSR